MKEIDKITFDFVFHGAIGWSELFCKAQDCLREVMKYSAPDIPDDLYLKCMKIVNVHELPKKYWKEQKNG